MSNNFRQPAPAIHKSSWYDWGKHKQHQKHNEGLKPLLLPLPQLPPTLDINFDDFARDYLHRDDLEKAIIRHEPSCESIDSALYGSTLQYDTSKQRLPNELIQLPHKVKGHIWRNLSYGLFTTYQRIFSLIILLNTIGMILLLRSMSFKDIEDNDLATWASSNFVIAIFIRHDLCINFIFRTTWLVPWNVPLRIRRSIARVYAYGGIHSGTAIAGTLWFVLFNVVVTIRFVQNHQYTVPVIVLSGSITALLLLIVLFSLPKLRSAYHNTFEITHRLLGWASIALFWSLFLLSTHNAARVSESSMQSMLIRRPCFWNLTAITVMLAQPWTRLRRWTFVPEKLSTHSMRLNFSCSIHRFSCLSISTSPLKEWHPFATFPSTDPTKTGGSIVISAAGDWTRSLINCPQPQTTFWVKGYPKAGVLSLSCIFRRVVFVTTGSGIGPCLSSLLDRPAGQSIRLVWSTRNPTGAYGQRLVEEVEMADPDALIIDTDQMGRPDLVSIAWMVWRETQAEAVFVLSNKTVTKKVVYGLESRGVPTFGPIWDS